MRKRHILVTFFWSCSITALAVQTATAQTAPVPEYLTQLGERLKPIEKRLQDANGDVMAGPSTRKTAVNRCDPEAMREAIAELEAIGRETKRVADAAALSAEFSTVDPEVAADANQHVQSSLRMWRGWLEHCVKRTQLSQTPAQPVTPSPPAVPPPEPKPASLRDQALTANFRHAQAADPCDPVAMARYMQELDRLVNEAEMDMMRWDGPMYQGIWQEKARDYDEIVKIREAARKRQADCPKDKRVGLNPQPQTSPARGDQTGTRPAAPVQQLPPGNAFPPGFHMYQELESLAGLVATNVSACDKAAFDEAKKALLDAIDRDLKLEQLTDQDKVSLRGRRQQAEAMQFPQPCPPKSTASTPVTQPPVVVKSAPGVAVSTPPTPPTLLDQARTALIEHAAAVGACDKLKMASNLFLLDSLFDQALRESMELSGSPFIAEEERRKAVLAEIMMHRDAAKKRQADCPKDLRIGLNPQERTFLDLHNQARSEVSAPPLQWDPALAASARTYALQLTSAGQLVHSSRVGRGNVRENLLQSLPGGRTPTQMIGMWTDEKKFFKPGLFPDVSTTGNWYDIGHYTQMIWPTTTHVGCAVAGDARFEWFVCHYRPGGNKDGKPVGKPYIPPPL